MDPVDAPGLQAKAKSKNQKKNENKKKKAADGDDEDEDDQKVAEKPVAKSTAAVEASKQVAETSADPKDALSKKVGQNSFYDFRHNLLT